MQNIIYMIVGGSAGMLSRYFLSNFINTHFETKLKLGTIVINLVGSLIIGAVWALFENNEFDPKIKNMITTGFLGCFTTYSTFSLETLNYINAREYSLAFFNIIISNALGILFVFVGYLTVKKLLHI